MCTFFVFFAAVRYACLLTMEMCRGGREDRQEALEEQVEEPGEEPGGAATQQEDRQELEEAAEGQAPHKAWQKLTGEEASSLGNDSGPLKGKSVRLVAPAHSYDPEQHSQGAQRAQQPWSLEVAG